MPGSFTPDIFQSHRVDEFDKTVEVSLDVIGQRDNLGFHQIIENHH